MNVLIFLLSFVLFSSCAYFNTFHNTKKLYKEATKEREKRQNDKTTPAEQRKYDETIEKASKILEVYPNSKYVDDALFILGECLYYKEQFIPAQRKFQELITYFPQSDYIQKAKLWLGKTNIALDDFASARVTLDELSKQDRIKDEIREESRFLLGEIFYNQEDYENANREYLEAGQIAKHKEIRARAYFMAGKCQLLIGQNQEAVRSFAKAIKNVSNKNDEFDARLHYARALKQAGDFKNAMRVCNSLLENTDYQLKFGHVQLEIADIVYFEGKALYDDLNEADLQFKGKIKEALDKYEIVLFQNKRTEVAAAAHYKMAKIKEVDLHDFAAAQESYQKVKLEFANSEFAEEATRRAENIADLIRLNNLVKATQGEQLMTASGGVRQLSALRLLLLEHAVHPELRYMDERGDSGAQPDANTSGNLANSENPEEKRDKLVANKLQLAEVYLFQFNQLDSAMAEYQQVIELFGDHSGAAKAIYSSAYIQDRFYKNKFKTDSLLYEVIRRFPDSEQANAAQRKLGLDTESTKEPAQVLFERAGSALFARNDLSKALESYRNIVDAYPDSDYAPRALYAIGWINDHKAFNKEEAAQNYRELIEKYPDFEYKAQLSQKLAAFEQLKENVVQEEEVEQPQEEIIAATSPEIPVNSTEEEGESVKKMPHEIVTKDRRPKTIERLRQSKRPRQNP